jgi:hypothetical protein
MKNQNIHFQYNVFLDKSSDILPKKIHLLDSQNYPQIKNIPVSAPLKYFADFLTASYLIQLHPYLKSPLVQKGLDYNQLYQVTRQLDPHVEVFHRAQARLQSIKKPATTLDKNGLNDFESSFSQDLDACLTEQGVDLSKLSLLSEKIDQLENSLNRSLLFNFDLSLNSTFVEKLFALHSLLFNLRSLIATDHNSHIEDATHEAVKVDSITDYLPKAEYVVNDALVYLQFKKLTAPFVRKKNTSPDDPHFSDLVIKPLDKVFQNYNYNGYCLAQQLSADFLQQLSPQDLEEKLYQLQMDWLLGSDAGLLFKIREELFALQWGYAKIFWPEVRSIYAAKETRLHINSALDVGLLESQVA